MSALHSDVSITTKISVQSLLCEQNSPFAIPTKHASSKFITSIRDMKIL